MLPPILQTTPSTYISLINLKSKLLVKIGKGLILDSRGDVIALWGMHVCDHVCMGCGHFSTLPHKDGVALRAPRLFFLSWGGWGGVDGDGCC